MGETWWFSYNRLDTKWLYSEESFNEPEGQFGEDGIYRIVGHGIKTNSQCGVFVGFKGCKKVDLHNKSNLKGFNYKGKVDVRIKIHSCDKPDCPVCYKFGWANRQAMKIEDRLSFSSQHFGLGEHIIASVPDHLYGLSLPDLRKWCVKALKARNIIGGCLIFHGCRYNVKGCYWYWSPHFHVLGHILGGVGGCRDCEKNFKKSLDYCLGCAGFFGLTTREYQNDGWVVKLQEKRKTIRGTAFYQLHHATLIKDVRRFHVVTWFGVCSYSKLKFTPEERKERCRICDSELENLRYKGDKKIITNREHPEFQQYLFEDLYDPGGTEVWYSVPGGCTRKSKRNG